MNKKMPRFNRIVQGFGIAAQEAGPNGHLLWVTDSTSVFKVFDPVTWYHTKEVQALNMDGTELNWINELEIIPESDTTPTGISNYAFVNEFFTTNVRMLDLRTGFVVHTWNFDNIMDHQNDTVREKLDEIQEQMGQDLTQLYIEKFENDDVKYFANFNNSMEEEHVFRHYASYDYENNLFNGIAYDSRDDTFLLTGKMYDNIYKVKIQYH